MDVSKLKECFLSIAAAALLHAGAPVEMAGRREHKTECISLQGKAAKNVTSQIIASETKCYRMSCTWVPHGSCIAALVSLC